MRLCDVMPDEWEKVSFTCSEKFKTQALNNMWDRDYMVNQCLDCPFSRPVIQGGLLYLPCVFVNKCIKQYPIYKDNEEFK